MTKGYLSVNRKRQRKPKKSQLQIIHLFEADYNLFLKLVWGKQMIRHTEEHHLLGEEMQGSRKNRGTMGMFYSKE